jgi:hypothetical protein
MSETKMKNGQLTKNKSKATTINFNSIALLNVFNDAEGKRGCGGFFSSVCHYRWEKLIKDV